MAQAATNPHVPDIDPRIPPEIERVLGRQQRWQNVAAWDLRQINDEYKLQVRDSENQAPKDNVTSYAVAMEFNSTGHIIVTRDGCVVDGYTRSGASLKRHQYFLPAIVLDLDYATASPQRRAELRALGATINNITNGERLSEREERRNAANMLSLGWPLQEISHSIQWSVSKISGLKAELDVRARMERLGIEPGNKLKSATLRALGQNPAANLYDGPWAALAGLAVDANFNATEVNDSARTLEPIRDEASQTAKVNEWRAEPSMAERIDHPDVPKHADASLLRQRLGFIVKYASDPLRLVELNESKMDSYIADLHTSIRVLETLVEEQEQRRPLTTGYSDEYVNLATETDEDDEHDEPASNDGDSEVA